MASGKTFGTNKFFVGFKTVPLNDKEDFSAQALSFDLPPKAEAKYACNLNTFNVKLQTMRSCGMQVQQMYSFLGKNTTFHFPCRHFAGSATIATGHPWSLIRPHESPYMPGFVIETLNKRLVLN